jgi:hypothetical protein
LGIIITAAAFLFLIDYFKTYRSEISFLFIPRSELTAIQNEQIAYDLVEIPKRLSFYEKMLNDSNKIEDEFFGFPKDRRKKMWNEKLEAQRESASGIITLKITDNNQSEEMAKQAARTLFDTMSLYYNIRTEVDFRIIDGPITSAEIKSWPLAIFLSLVAGILITIFTYYLSNASEQLILSLGGRRLSGITKSKEEKEEYLRMMAPAIKPSVTQIKKAEAPNNLPVADAGSLLAADIMEEKKEINIEPAEIMEQEPTEQELKDRLNKLLRGEM